MAHCVTQWPTSCDVNLSVDLLPRHWPGHSVSEVDHVFPWIYLSYTNYECQFCESLSKPSANRMGFIVQKEGYTGEKCF